MNNLEAPINLLELHSSRQVARFSSMSQTLETLTKNVSDVVAGYRELCLTAPQRHKKNKIYFVGHSGYPSGNSISNRREEHLAMALWNDAQDAPFQLPDQHVLQLLDYQVPLKASRADKGVGKLDLLGMVDSSLCVIELKIHREDGQLGESPLRAYLEALAYSAIVQANLTAIGRELGVSDMKLFANHTPAVIVLAPEEYWLRLFDNALVASSWPLMRNFADAMNKQIGVQTHFLSMTPSEFAMGSENQKPYLYDRCQLFNASNLVQ